MEKLLPWLLAAAAGLVLAFGLQGFRAERAVSLDEPVSTTPVVTEISDDIAEVVLPDGAVLVLRPGNVGYDLARFLNGAEDPPASFPAQGLLIGDTADGETQRTLLAIAAILRAYPSARLRIEAEPAALHQLKARIEGAGVPPDRVESGSFENPAPPVAATLILTSR